MWGLFLCDGTRRNVSDLSVVLYFEMVYLISLIICIKLEILVGLVDGNWDFYKEIPEKRHFLKQSTGYTLMINLDFHVRTFSILVENSNYQNYRKTTEDRKE